ncbi:MAG: hypothetical protein KGH63_03230, partial [Candidatus Micrarchaeota archaeon]|nr:hypothetical protein [Candidatus Micrarchaeota archaeon]
MAPPQKLASSSNRSVVSLCQQLVRIDSVTGREGDAADFIVKFCQKHRLPFKRLHDSVVILPASRIPAKTAVIFYAHIDTVPAGDEKSWRY